MADDRIVSATSAELRKMYADAAAEGIWLHVFMPSEDGRFLAAAARMDMMQRCLEEDLVREEADLKQQMKRHQAEFRAGVRTYLKGDLLEQECRKRREADEAWSQEYLEAQKYLQAYLRKYPRTDPDLAADIAMPSPTVLVPWAHLGEGRTREEACREAIREMKESSADLERRLRRVQETIRQRHAEWAREHPWRAKFADWRRRVFGRDGAGR